MKIEYLADCTEHVPVLAKWFHDEWGYLLPEIKLEDRKKRLYARANRKSIPIAFVAVGGKEPMGSASIVECDMDTHSHLKPWLSSVYVSSDYRNRGIGTKLVTRIIEEVKLHGFPILYLWTPKKEKFYAKRGWALIERTTYKNENASVMEYLLE
jgi:GNAT superfamily N-acetyltransferase